MILSGLIFLPLFFIPALLFVKKTEQLKSMGLVFSLIHLAYGVYALRNFVIGLNQYQFVEGFDLFKPLGVHYAIGVDGVSLILVALSLFLMPLIILGTWDSTKERVKLYFSCLFCIQTCLIGTFLSLDLVLFYLFFESSLLPMLILLGALGGKRKVYAAKKLFIFTFGGSLLLLGSIITMMVLHESVHGVPSSLMTDLQTIQLPFVSNTLFSTQTILFFGFLIAFAVKVPLFPLHTWLPDAHVEAPTGGSVLLAGLMLKMGTYGMIRFLSLYFQEASHHYGWVVCLLALVGIVYGAMVSFAQTDIKKLIAYSSVSHMGYVVLGIFCWNSLGHQGASFQMVSHGLNTGALFLMIGMLYERFHTRDLKDFGGLAKLMPKFTICFVLVSLASISMPLTNGFIGELLILMGVFKVNLYYGLLAVCGVFLGAIYMLNMIKEVFFGETNERLIQVSPKDLSLREALVLVPIIIIIMITGLFPALITQFLNYDSASQAKNLMEAVLYGVG